VLVIEECFEPWLTAASSVVQCRNVLKHMKAQIPDASDARRRSSVARTVFLNQL
jgi:hypothetical protein